MQLYVSLIWVHNYHNHKIRKAWVTSPTVAGGRGLFQIQNVSTVLTCSQYKRLLLIKGLNFVLSAKGTSMLDGSPNIIPTYVKYHAIVSFFKSSGVLNRDKMSACN